MRRFVIAGLAAMLFAWPLSGAASAGRAAPAPALSAQMVATLATLPPGDMTRVVVTMRAQADLAAVRGQTRAARLRKVIQVLEDSATATQSSIRALLRTRAAEGAVRNVTPMWIVNALSVTATPSVIEELAARPDVASITSDQVWLVPTATATAEANIARIGAPAMWDQGDTGQGVVVATLDSGVDMTNPDLAARWRSGTNSWFDPYGQHPTTPTDLSGHGTATMGVIVGGDSGGTSIGVAPGASWIAAKIFNDAGAATATAVHQAFQWVLDPDHDPLTNDAPQIVNGSWSLGTGPGCDLSFQPDVQALRTAGIVPVFAAGNFGPGAGTSVSPANYPESVAVGSVTANDLVDATSSRGPTTCGGRTSVYPDLVAPGSTILTSDRYGLYQYVSGTSIAAPHVSGALALLLSAKPGLAVDRQVAALTGSAHDLGVAGPDSSYGYGRVDAPAALQWIQSQPDFTLAMTPASVSATAGDATSFTVQVGPLNGFSGDAALSLSGLPAGSSAQFTPAVISGGSGTAQLSVTTSHADTPGLYPLTVTATSGTLTHTAGASLNLAPAADFGIGATPTNVTLTPGGSTSVTVDVGALNGFTGTVSLTADGLPASVGTASLTPAEVSGAGSSQLRLSLTSDAPPGGYQAVVTGTSGGLIHSVAIAITVPASADFAMAATPSTATVNAGSSASFSMTVTALAGFSGPVSLTVSGPPTDVATATISPTSVTGSGTAKLKVSAKTSAPSGTYPVTVTGSSGSHVHSVTVLLTVQGRDFTLDVTPTSATVIRGSAVSVTVSVAALNGFARKVTLCRSGLPPTTTASWSKSSITGSGSSTLRIKTTASTPPGSYSVLICGTSGALNHQVTVTLTVT